MPWYSWFLFPFSLLYGFILEVRNLLFNIGIRKSYQAPIPIISVGNLAVGGTGKTPHVQYLIQLLEPKYKVAILSRGYGRATHGFIEVLPSSLSKVVGDEPLEIKHAYPSTPVFVCEKRKEGIQEILKLKPDIEVIILDDAFQHRQVKPSLNLVLSQYHKPYFKDWPMPMGRLREFRWNITRADAVVFTKCPLEIESHYQKNKAYYSYLDYAEPRPVHNEYLEAKDVLFLSALASDDLPWKHISSQFNKAKRISLPDHYAYSRQDVAKWTKAYPDSHWITTEKDWTKLQELKSSISGKVSVLSIQVFFQDGSFNELVLNHLKSWKR
jgi:tetraacyldisaccharide 4'-kinase